MRRSTVRGQPWQGQGTKARRKWILNLPTVQLGPSIYHHWCSYKQDLYLQHHYIYHHHSFSSLRSTLLVLQSPESWNPGWELECLIWPSRQSKQIDCFSCLTTDWTSAATERHRQWLTNKPNSVPSSSELWTQLYGTTHSWNHLESFLPGYSKKIWLQIPEQCHAMTTAEVRRAPADAVSNSDSSIHILFINIFN